ncbi:hypothetical protein RGQ29_013898 [Quercus rubra]|uniref:UspA domain-containing protein n=1 Tax=Quercus rubra TaxID=3512 RepID=A0AAN7IZW7_QUERU|nr:hypothetical protein RGQ29_013898 [Quercus rubra]
MADVATKEWKILVAVDEGEESMHALSWCLKNVLLLLSLILVCGFGSGYLFSADMMVAMDKYSNDVAECVVEKAKKMCKDLHDVKVETRIEHGDPRDVICQMTEKLGADVLVMGSHGYGLIKRALLGSVSNHCAQNVQCPVLIVKKPKSTAANN